MKHFKGTKGIIILVVMALLICGYYYYLSNHKKQDTSEEKVTLTAVQEVLMRNLETNYPPSPKEVLKYYMELTKCLHNEELSEDDLYALAMKILELYDIELAQNKTKEEYLTDLKSEITTFHDHDYAISSYYTSTSTDVDYFEDDGYSFARLYGTYSIRVKTSMQSLEEIFLLRKDDSGHWKIFGWQQVTEQETNEDE